MLKWLNEHFPEKFASRLEGDAASPDGTRTFAMGAQNFTVLSSTGKFKNYP